MKQSKKNFPFMLFAGLLSFSGSQVQANSQFWGFATISFVIDSIENAAGGEVNLSDLEFRGTFEHDSFSSYSVLTGNGFLTISPVLGSDEAVVPNVDYTQTFSVSGSAGNGTVDSYHLGLYGLRLYNDSETKTYSINLNFSYELKAQAVGQYADSTVTIDYFSDEDLLFAGQAYANHSTIFNSPFYSVNGSGLFSIDLGPKAEVFYLADVGVKGDLSAVPLPAASWFFMSGLLLIMGVRKKIPSA